MGHHIIVGRRTFESIGRALPGRHTIIVTRAENYRCPPANLPDNEAGGGSCSVVQSVEEAIELAESRGETEVFICGGAEIYRQAMALAERLYLTFVEAEVEADTFFPAWDDTEWEVRESAYQAADERNQYSFLFKVFKKHKEDTKIA